MKEDASARGGEKFRFAAYTRVPSQLLSSQFKMEGLLARYGNWNTEKMNARC